MPRVTWTTASSAAAEVARASGVPAAGDAEMDEEPEEQDPEPAVGPVGDGQPVRGKTAPLHSGKSGQASPAPEWRT